MGYLKRFSTKKVKEYKNKIEGNYSVYTGQSGEFDCGDVELNINTGIEYDEEVFSGLDHQVGGTQNVINADKKNSKLIGKAFQNLTPYQAQDERIWTRVTHCEGLEYSRQRWITSEDKEKNIKSISKHFFASGLNAKRDDNALSFLWWNHFLAKKYTYQIDPTLVGPHSEGLALNTYDNNLDVILGSADLRLNLIQRTGISRRVQLVQGIIRLCLREGMHNNYDDQTFRRFMRAVNIIAPQQNIEIYDQGHPEEPFEMDELVYDAFKLAKKL